MCLIRRLLLRNVSQSPSTGRQVRGKCLVHGAPPIFPGQVHLFHVSAERDKCAFADLLVTAEPGHCKADHSASLAGSGNSYSDMVIVFPCTAQRLAFRPCCYRYNPTGMVFEAFWR